jgi:hypothetical protein
MKIGNWARLLLSAAPLLAGCGDFWQAPGSTSSGACTTNCTTASSGDFYILNSGTTPEIAGESIASGTLTAISGSPWTLSGAPYSIAIAPNGNFLCVSTTSGVFAYPIANGKLGSATVVSSDQAYAIQIDATNSWLIEAMPATGGVIFGAVPISTTTGALTGIEQNVSFAVPNAALQTNKMVISLGNNYIFAALGAGGTIVVPFSSSSPFPSGISASTLAVANTGGVALSVAVDPAGRLFYIGETLANPAGTSGGLRAFTLSSLSGSSLTQATGSPIASGGLAPNFILPNATGSYVFVANGAGASTAGNITGFAVTASGSTDSLATGSTVAAGIQPLGLAEDSTGTFVLAVGSAGSPYFDAYTFDSTTTGKLDSQITSTTSAGSIAIVAAP